MKRIATTLAVLLSLACDLQPSPDNVADDVGDSTGEPTFDVSPDAPLDPCCRCTFDKVLVCVPYLDAEIGECPIGYSPTLIECL